MAQLVGSFYESHNLTKRKKLTNALRKRFLEIVHRDADCTNFSFCWKIKHQNKKKIKIATKSKTSRFAGLKIFYFLFFIKILNIVRSLFLLHLVKDF